MRLAVVSSMDGWSWGGSEELWALVVDEALERGDQVLLALHDAMREAPRVQVMRQRGVIVATRAGGLRARRTDRARALLGTRLSWRLSPLRPVLTFQPDVVLLSEGAAFDVIRPGLVEDVARVAAAVPLVWLSQLNIEGAQAEFVRQRGPEVIGLARSTVFVSERNRTNAERQLARRLSDTHVVQNPLVFDAPDAVPWPANEVARFATVARLDVAYKGQDVVLEALASATWRDREWSLSIVGAGQDERYLRRLTSMFDLDDRVGFVGHVSDLREFWRSHHLLLLGSRAEGTPLAMLEAMACGRPVVATDVGGVTEWVRDAVDGMIANAPTAASVGEALQRAWQVKDRWQTMGISARHRFEDLRDLAPQETLLRIIDDAR